MQPSDRKAFATLILAVSEYHGKQLSPEVLRIYWDGLSGYEFEDVQRILNEHLRNPDTGQFMPKVADVVKFIEGSTLTQAMRAWRKVEHAIHAAGGWQSVVFDDFLIHAVISDMGGWELLCQTTKDELVFKIREFERRFQGYRLRSPGEYPRRLIGRFERENAVHGYATQPPMLIGDPQSAQLVYQGGADKQPIGMTPMKALLEVARA
jgi:hypothetical protein